ncbi:MAG: ubiquinol-cytochrome C chaperone family protein [Pseudomonadota bacterium]|nr:ubiquinol-cytochrome C chaperone family protein [Pseudomonadota bacterium]
MLFKWRAQKRRNEAIVDALYAAVTDWARQPKLYEDGGVPDTVMGRFEALAIAMYLFLRRCRDDARLAPLAQDVVDRFVTDMDHSLREIGIGYQAVPKRMRKLAGRFYERVSAYDGAMEGGQDAKAALGEALAGRAIDENAPEDVRLRLADHMLVEAGRLSAVPSDHILSGRLKEDEAR